MSTIGNGRWAGRLVLAGAALILAAGAGREAAQAAGDRNSADYEIGGQLEGPRIVQITAQSGESAAQPALVGKGPRVTFYPTRHGEAPGYPGCIPELAEKARQEREQNPLPPGSEDFGVEFTQQMQWPQYQLYPGSIENFRAYWGKYVPVRSFFDAGSLLKNWVAPELPGAAAGTVEQYAAPVYWVPRHSIPRDTALLDPPVPVVRMKVKIPALNLDLGQLATGMYAIRVIGAVETNHIGLYRKPLYLALAVNDGVRGEEQTYRLRLAFQSEFYSVAEFYFHAPEKRAYKARLWVDEGSAIDLLVHNVDLHDVLAGTERRAVKRRMTLTTPQEVAMARRAATEKEAQEKEKNPRNYKPPVIRAAIEDLTARLARDEQLWKALPPLNAQLGGMYGLQKGYSQKVVFGANGKTMAELNKEYGEWTRPIQYPTGLEPVLIVNKKLNLTYTMDDLAARKPLPDPYPVKDCGAGVATPSRDGKEPQQEFTVIADAAVGRFEPWFRHMVNQANRFQATGDAEAGWDAAFQLCRAAWQYPSMDAGQSLGAVVSDPGGFERDMHCRRRDGIGWGFGGNGLGYDDLLASYDKVYDFIKGNEKLAESVRRFVPWVKTSKDVIELLDVCAVQVRAKQILRFLVLSDNDPAMVVMPAALLGDPKVTDPWMEWLFAKAYVYPNPPAGLNNTLITGNTREGTGYIASWMYCGGENAIRPALDVEKYVKADGNPRYDLTNGKNYPKVHEFTRWSCWDTWLAGLQFPRVGDVCGPDKPYGNLFKGFMENAGPGWRWTKEPEFAFILKHVIGRQKQSDEEWQAIEKAAAGVKRAPWLENRSRVLPGWFGALESGTQYDDPRFRRSAMLRIGLGYGHQHNDTLDLQVTAHGLPMTIDGGQRRGYNKPGDDLTRVHNLVEVDGKNWIGHAWVRTLSDAAGARYQRAEAVPPVSHSNITYYGRQIALIDVDEGQGAKPLAPEQMLPNAKLEAGVTTPNSYVFDVVRVSGGKVHTYCFHGPLEDELAVNLEGKAPYAQLADTEQDYLKIFQDRPITNYPNYPILPQRYGGKAPEVLEATWRMAVEIPGTGMGEKEMSPGIWSPENPRKYTRLHLLGQKDARVMTGWSWCRQWSYGYNNLFTQRRSETETDAVFPALIEPYAGKPFIAQRRLLAIPGNEADANRAVAVEVQTVNGRTDLCFADGRPEKVREVRSQASEFRMAGEFAYVSKDKDGLRQATLSGGTLLQGPEATLRLERGERVAKIAAVDYGAKQFALDQEWPEGGLLKGSAVEVGVPGRMTTYMIDGVTRAEAGKSLVTTRGGADLFMAQIVSVDPAKREVVCGLGLPHIPVKPCPGVDKQLVASNMERTKFWRAEYLGRPDQAPHFVFRLDGPVAAEDFGKESRFRLWEYGTGDTVRQALWASLRRVEGRTYELTANGDVTVTLPGGKLETSADGKTWQPAPGKAEGKQVTATINFTAPGGKGLVFLRVP